MLLVPLIRSLDDLRPRLRPQNTERLVRLLTACGLEAPVPPPQAHTLAFTSSDGAFMAWFHACFAAGAAVVLSPCMTSLPSYRSGPAVCVVVLGWHAAFARCTQNTRPRLHAIWAFTCPLSIFLVLPDWFLVASLGTLAFPDDGAWRVGGAVSVYMAGMWSIPLTCLLACFPTTSRPPDGQHDVPSVLELVLAALAAFLIFGAAEQLTVPLLLWRATDRCKVTAGHVALYVLPAEACLGAATLHAYRATAATTGWAGVARRVLAAAAVALLYTGALALSHMVIEEGVAA